MKTITIMFSTTKRFSSRFLRWAQRCQFSHVEIMFDNYSIGARSRGVKKYDDYDYFINTQYRYMDVSDEQYEKFYKFMHDKVGGKYDWRAYLGFALFKKTHSKNRWFCSELLQEAFTHAGIDVLVNAPAYYTQPRDFWISPVLSNNRTEQEQEKKDA